jgi:hypothetical protein
MKKIPQTAFVFRTRDAIGSTAAEDDSDFLFDCFVDTGDLNVLMNTTSSFRIILGRTGTGKTALLERLAQYNKEIINILPENLSFNYLTNSTILKYFLEAGVKLDLFFKLLWRHVFTVELIKKKYNIKNEEAKKTFLEKIGYLLTRDKKKEKAIAYLQKWGEKFWEDTEYRIQEITNKIENELKGSLGTIFPAVDFNMSGISKLSEEEKTEIVKRGQEVINKIQMRELTNIIEFLNDDVFDDEKQPFYITIDKLDENWVEDKFRYLLIRNLIETVREFRKIRNVKVIIVLRTDLLERVFRYTRDPGFQEEKYRSLFLRIKWSKHELEELLDKRINHLVKRRYTKKAVGYKDVFPKTINKIVTIDYIIDRTMRRPRELIEFVNECIAQAKDKPFVTKNCILDAEAHYSQNRIRSLQDEWYADWPNLLKFVQLLRNKPYKFELSDLNQDEIIEFCCDYMINNTDGTDSLSMSAYNLVDSKETYENFIKNIFHVLHRTGTVGIKKEAYESYNWIYKTDSTIAASTINMNSGIMIHPGFWRNLGTYPIDTTK